MSYGWISGCVFLVSICFAEWIVQIWNACLPLCSVPVDKVTKLLFQKCLSRVGWTAQYNCDGEADIENLCPFTWSQKQSHHVWDEHHHRCSGSLLSQYQHKEGIGCSDCFVLSSQPGQETERLHAADPNSQNFSKQVWCRAHIFRISLISLSNKECQNVRQKTANIELDTFLTHAIIYSISTTWKHLKQSKLSSLRV